jgi:hypothetical protein
MKKNLVILVVILLGLTSCASDSSSSTIDSNILVDNVPFKPSKATVANATSSYIGQTALHFTLEKGVAGTSNYESINFKINYPLISSSAPNGVYDFGIGVIGEMLFASGEYVKNNSYFGMAGYTVKVTALGGKRYKLEFQNIQAVNIVNQDEVILTGSYEGDFMME